jgi:hypothetical protein
VAAPGLPEVGVAVESEAGAGTDTPGAPADCGTGAREELERQPDATRRQAKESVRQERAGKVRDGNKDMKDLREFSVT